MAKFCKKCGKKIRLDEYSHNGECEECYNNKNCKRCNKEIIGSQSPSGYCEECYEIIQEEEKEKQKRYCPNCGKEVDSSSNVCYNCGVNPQKIKKMKFCYYCGKAVNEEQVICLNCKKKLENTEDEDCASGVMIILCLLFPIIGIIVYIANASTKPHYARSCGIASLISFIIGSIAIGLMYMS